MMTFFLVFLGLLVIYILAKFLYKSWWYPISIQSLMKSQGIRGPPYKFPNGNETEIRDMEMKSNTGHIALRHDIFSIMQPHLQSWIKLYGNHDFLSFITNPY